MTRNQFKRGADADLSFTPEEGEPIWTNGATYADQRLWMGDATDPKGIQVGWPFAPNPGHKSGWYYPSAMPLTAFNTAAMAINIISYTPIHFGGGLQGGGDASIQSLHAEVTTLQAAKNFRLAIYENSNGVPRGLIAESGNISTATTGVKTWSTTQVLVGGWYWLAVFTDANTAVFKTNDNLATGGGILGFQGSAFTLTNTYYEVAAFGAFPDPAALTGAASLDVVAVKVRMT